MTTHHLFADLVVIDDPKPLPAGLNMALDEVLLVGLGSVALLRCYRWSEPSVSFGCFGPYMSVRQAYPERVLVRRWTGGGVVEHGADFTFSLLIPRGLALANMAASDSYRRIHGVVAQALSNAGLHNIELAQVVAERLDADPREKPFLKPCFQNPVAHDLMIGNRKIVGGAQRRSKSGLLYQGSVQGRLPGTAVGWYSHQPMVAIFAQTFAQCWSSRIVSPAEFALAEQLASTKYGSPAWNERF